MGRRKLTNEEITDKYQDLKEVLDYYKEKITEATDDETKNIYTKKISAIKKNIGNFKRQYINRLTPEGKKQEEKNINKKIQILPVSISLKTKMAQIEEMANELIANASTEEERKKIKEQLYYTKLRYRYSI